MSDRSVTDVIGVPALRESIEELEALNARARTAFADQLEMEWYSHRIAEAAPSLIVPSWDSWKAARTRIEAPEGAPMSDHSRPPKGSVTA